MDLPTLIAGGVLLLIGTALGVVLGRAWAPAASPGADRSDAMTIGALLAPAADALVRVEDQLRQIETDRIGSYAGLREQLTHLQQVSAELGHQTRGLASALQAPQVRGRWGELTLQRIVELAGMTEHCDFQTQLTVVSEDARARPDLVVRLSGGRSIPVDAKVPLTAWLQAAGSDSPGEQSAGRAAHARAMRQHVEQLSGKAYWRHFQPSPEFVVLFVPGEAILDAALSSDPDLTDFALSRNVVIATPTTLVVLLRTVAFGWRQEQLSAHAEEVHRLGRQLHERLGTVGDHLSRLGESLTRTVTAYNSAVGSIESRVLVTARRLTDLGVGTTGIASPAQVELLPRTPQATEFVRDTRR